MSTSPKTGREIGGAFCAFVVLFGLVVTVTLCIIKVPCVKEPTPAPVEHSVLVLPPDVEKRIAGLEKRLNDILGLVIKDGELIKQSDDLRSQWDGELSKAESRLTALETELAELKKNQCKCHK